MAVTGSRSRLSVSGAFWGKSLLNQAVHFFLILLCSSDLMICDILLLYGGGKGVGGGGEGGRGREGDFF